MCPIGHANGYPPVAHEAPPAKPLAGLLMVAAHFDKVGEVWWWCSNDEHSAPAASLKPNDVCWRERWMVEQAVKREHCQHPVAFIKQTHTRRLSKHKRTKTTKNCYKCLWIDFWNLWLCGKGSFEREKKETFYLLMEFSACGYLNFQFLSVDFCRLGSAEGCRGRLCRILVGIKWAKWIPTGWHCNHWSSVLL